MSALLTNVVLSWAASVVVLLAVAMFKEGWHRPRDSSNSLEVDDAVIIALWPVMVLAGVLDATLRPLGQWCRKNTRAYKAERVRKKIMQEDDDDT